MSKVRYRLPSPFFDSIRNPRRNLALQYPTIPPHSSLNTIGVTDTNYIFHNTTAYHEFVKIGGVIVWLINHTLPTYDHVLIFAINEFIKLNLVISQFLTNLG
ncbi:hypothetical protein SAMN05443246_5048 [Paenibacillus sp. GP183]|nr:hypothetical protein SAMN05443246_5048 [Paenibacillus sp. GP183]